MPDPRPAGRRAILLAPFAAPAAARQPEQSRRILPSDYDRMFRNGGTLAGELDDHLWVTRYHADGRMEGTFRGARYAGRWFFDRSGFLCGQQPGGEPSCFDAHTYDGEPTSYMLADGRRQWRWVRYFAAEPGRTLSGPQEFEARVGAVLQDAVLVTRQGGSFSNEPILWASLRGIVRPEDRLRVTARTDGVLWFPSAVADTQGRPLLARP